jgi:hypothetical protein
VIVREPISAHAPLGEDDVCLAHERGPDPYGHDASAFAREMAEREPRIWRVTGNDQVTATWVAPAAALKFPDGALLHRPPRVLRLTPDTQLRLDAWERGRYFDGGDHVMTTRRFCVLDGPLAGTCWEGTESVSMDPDETWRIADPVEPSEQP